MEAIRVQIENPLPGMRIKYQAHVQTDGWQDWVYDGDIAGTVGEGKRIEAIRIRIVNETSTELAQSETARIQSISNNGNRILYTYDNNGNIKTTTEDGKGIEYFYDEWNQLIRENNGVLDKTVIYAYDAGGNLTGKTDYPYTEGGPGEPVKAYAYLYEDANWKDKLTSFDGKAITYDEIGNPLAQP